MAQSQGLPLSVGGAQHWSSMKGHSPLSVTVEKLVPSNGTFGFPPGQQLQMLQRQAADPWYPGLMKNESPSQRSTIWLSSSGHPGN